MKAVIDTSALISLGCAEILKKSAELLECSLPSEVHSEIRELSKYDDAEGNAASRVLDMISEGKLIQLVIAHKENAEALISADVQHGEASCFVLCVERKISLLIMDDIDASFALSNKAHVQGIRMRISVAVAVELCRQGRISKSQLKTVVGKLIKQRRWEGGVLEVLAHKYLDDLQRQHTPL